MPPKSILFDRSKKNYLQKAEAFTGVKNLTLITPSEWLANLTRESFLSEYRTEVIHNTIDLNIFKPTPSNFRKRFHLEEKKVILGVAVPWTERKGLNDFVKLASMIGHDYSIVLVGLSDEQKKKMPSNVIALGRTNNLRELAEIYTAADVFFNPTYEDNYPTVNLEAEACGTMVITYKTGGAPETIRMQSSKVIEQGNFSFLVEFFKKEEMNDEKNRVCD